MRALTLIAPMGQAIIADHPLAKRVENRLRQIPDSVMKESNGVVAIHSGKKWNDEYVDTIRDILGIGVVDFAKAQNEHAGKIIGLMRFSGKIYTPADPPTDPTMRRWFTGPCGMEIVDAVALKEPIYGRGRQSYWVVPEAEASLILQQVGEEWRK